MHMGNKLCYLHSDPITQVLSLLFGRVGVAVVQLPELFRLLRRRTRAPFAMRRLVRLEQMPMLGTTGGVECRLSTVVLGGMGYLC